MVAESVGEARANLGANSKTTEDESDADALLIKKTTSCKMVFLGRDD
jgi:hypothetical protein